MKKIGILMPEVKFGEEPLETDVLNGCYKDFITILQSLGAEAYLAPWQNYEKCKITKGVTFSDGWKEAHDINVDVVMDKFPFNDETNALRESMKKEVGLVNDPRLETFFFFFLNTYQTFSEFVSKTFTVNTLEEYEKSVKQITSSKVVIKPRYGLDGIDVHIIEKNEQPSSIEKDTIIMDWVDTTHGNKTLGIKGTNDVRCVVINGEIDHALCRSSEKSLITNYYQGGKMHFIDIKDVPSLVLEKVKIIDKKIEHIHPRIYCADFMIDGNGKVWLIEMNSKPGLHMFQEWVSDPKIKAKQEQFHRNVGKVLICQDTTNL
jgi:glutathione synthase/RimK-type ligase-like ATP-grasp enzyme